jgi:hypothetical protein
MENRVGIVVYVVFPSRRGLLSAVHELTNFLALEFAKLAAAVQSSVPALEPALVNAVVGVPGRQGRDTKQNR